MYTSDTIELEMCIEMLYLKGFSESNIFILNEKMVGYTQRNSYVKIEPHNFYVKFSFNLITLKSLVPFRWGFLQNAPLQMRTSINRKLKMSHVRLPTESPRLHHIMTMDGVLRTQV